MAAASAGLAAEAQGVRLTRNGASVLGQLKEILQAIITFGVICYGGWQYWRFLGGRNALRNPWVLGPAAAGILGLLIALLESVHTDRVHAGLAVARPDGVKALIMMSAMFAATIGLGWAALASVRRSNKVIRLLRIPEAEFGVALSMDESDQLRHLAEANTHQADLEALLPLLEQTGAPRAFEWLTPEWVRERLSVVSSGSNKPIHDSLGRGA